MGKEAAARSITWDGAFTPAYTFLVSSRPFREGPELTTITITSQSCPKWRPLKNNPQHLAMSQYAHPSNHHTSYQQSTVPRLQQQHR